MLNPGGKRSSRGSAGSGSLFPIKRDTGMLLKLLAPLGAGKWIPEGIWEMRGELGSSGKDIPILQMTPDPRDPFPWDGKPRRATPSNIPGATSSDKSLFFGNAGASGTSRCRMGESPSPSFQQEKLGIPWSWLDFLWNSSSGGSQMLPAPFFQLLSPSSKFPESVEGSVENVSSDSSRAGIRESSSGSCWERPGDAGIRESSTGKNG